ncbi:MAG: LCP family protein [Clostridia bacterium]|nr:LCP family protein [Clostridia bacterium]
MANIQKNSDENKETRIFSAEDNGMSKPSHAQSEEESHRIRNVKMQTPDYLRAVLLILIVMTVAAVITVIAIGAFYRPEPPSTDVPFDTDTRPPETEPGVVTEPVDPVPNYAELRNNNVINFLVVGKDRAAYNTDVMMIVNFNLETYKVNVVQVPRDTYIEHEGWDGRVNALYAHYVYLSPDNMTAKQQRAYALERTVDAFEKSFYIKIDYYFLVNLDVVRSIVDGIGGVVIDIPFDMYYKDDTPGVGITIDLKAGVHRLTGEQAEQFIRFRDGYLLADISRMDAQKMFLSALFTQLKENISIENAIAVASSVFGNVTTNMEFDSAQFYLRELFKIDLENITMLTVAGEGCRVGEYGAWMYAVARDAMLDTVNKFLNVYTEPILDSIFDASGSLVDEEDEDMMVIYNSDRTYTAVGADKTGDIYIPHEE